MEFKWVPVDTQTGSQAIQPVDQPSKIWESVKLPEFLKLQNSPQSTFDDTVTYGNDVLNEKTCRMWFSAGGFKKDHFSLKDEPITGHSKNSILSNRKLPLMKIQPALLEN
ncbi:hypothetical protein ACTXT7_008360 [Hymenolepis weldensis]